jgi:hypothetical protein
MALGPSPSASSESCAGVFTRSESFERLGEGANVACETSERPAGFLVCVLESFDAGLYDGVHVRDRTVPVVDGVEYNEDLYRHTFRTITEKETAVVTRTSAAARCMAMASSESAFRQCLRISFVAASDTAPLAVVYALRKAVRA